jgi:hypothetical protein
MRLILGVRLHLFNSLGSDKIQEQLKTHSTFKMTLQFKRKYSTQGSGAPCHVSFGFFSGFCGIILPELQIDPQPESTTQPKTRGLLHMECDFAIALPYKFQLQDNTSIVEDLQERNSRTLGNYSRNLQDYSRPRDASSILEDFRLVVLGDACGLLVKAIKISRNYPARLQSTRGLSYGPPWAHYLGGYEDGLLGGPLGLPGLCHTAPDGVRRKDYGGEVLE